MPSLPADDAKATCQLSIKISQIQCRCEVRRLFFVHHFSGCPKHHASFIISLLVQSPSAQPFQTIFLVSNEPCEMSSSLETARGLKLSPKSSAMRFSWPKWMVKRTTLGERCAYKNLYCRWTWTFFCQILERCWVETGIDCHQTTCVDILVAFYWRGNVFKTLSCIVADGLWKWDSRTSMVSAFLDSPFHNSNLPNWSLAATQFWSLATSCQQQIKCQHHPNMMSWREDSCESRAIESCDWAIPSLSCDVKIQKKHCYVASSNRPNVAFFPCGASP